MMWEPGRPQVDFYILDHAGRADSLSKTHKNTPPIL